MKILATLLLLPCLMSPLFAAEETPLSLKILSCKAIFEYLKLDTGNTADVDLCLSGLHGIKGRGPEGLTMIYAGRPAASAVPIICETRIAKKDGAAVSTVVWCDTMAPETAMPTDSLALKAAISGILQLMKDIPRAELPKSHPVLTALKAVAAPKNHPEASQFIVGVEERDMMRAETMGIIVDGSGKVLEMKILKSIP